MLLLGHRFTFFRTPTQFPVGRRGGHLGWRGSCAARGGKLRCDDFAREHPHYVTQQTVGALQISIKHGVTPTKVERERAANELTLGDCFDDY